MIKGFLFIAIISVPIVIIAKNLALTQRLAMLKYERKQMYDKLYRLQKERICDEVSNGVAIGCYYRPHPQYDQLDVQTDKVVEEIQELEDLLEFGPIIYQLSYLARLW